ncbi:MAG: DUF2227 family putative metal-binding protein [Candidatus Bipolaricaulota bacterium]|nr:MAG: DUF2227 family putative metal-binding protein [Candidatus Bipolaricaulota bacterium]
MLGSLSAAAAVAASRGGLSPGLAAAFLGAFLFATLLLSPDLDLARSDAARRWGIARILWLPYAKLFRHRRVSHRPVLGPLTRIVYFAVLVLAGFVAVRAAGGRPMTIRRPGWTIVGAAVLGLYAPNLLHILLDRITGRVRGPSRR